MRWQRLDVTPPARCGMALHVGEVSYGNIGAGDRLDFTAIGPAVNLTARLEPLTKQLERPLLVSATLRRARRDTAAVARQLSAARLLRRRSASTGSRA